MHQLLVAVALLPCASAWLGAPHRPASRRSSGAISMGAVKTVKVGLVGGGTVGGGIVEILRNKEDAVKALGVDIDIARICVGNIDKPRDFAVPDGCELTTDPNSILDDASIDMVVEVMGGTGLAGEVVEKALKAGKHVVTANKALIAERLPKLQKLLNEVNSKRDEPVQFGFEAAVCGGIPIIGNLQRDFLGDEISQISGIINGCTNYMLSNMAASGKSYDEALAEASELGYAEADPTLDVGGFDARSKLSILMKLGFGIDVDEEQIPCRGITDVTTTDFEYAKMLAGTVKLLGVAKLDDDRDELAAYVSPVFVPSESTLAGINGATNAVQVTSSNLQSSVFVGQGAGRFPTANSCVSDILAICQGVVCDPFPKVAPPSLQYVSSYSGSFYVRIRFQEQMGIIKNLGEIFSASGVSIYSILQNPIKNPNDAQFVVITEECEVGELEQACAALEATDWCLGDTFYMPVLSD